MAPYVSGIKSSTPKFLLGIIIIIIIDWFLLIKEFENLLPEFEFNKNQFDSGRISFQSMAAVANKLP